MEAACTGKDWWTCGDQAASCSSWRLRARTKTGGPVVVRQLVAHHGGGVNRQKLVDLWCSVSSLLIIEAACTGKDCGPVVVIQLVAHHGDGVHGKRLVDLWWSDN